MQIVKKRKGKTKVWIVVLSIVVVLGVVLAGGIILTASARKELQNAVIAEVDFKKLKDGVYTGEYRSTKESYRNAAVEVTVSSGTVTEIRVTEGALAGDKQETEIKKGITINSLFDEVIKSQSLQVDVISGATLTSKAHLKALENALKQAEGE
jgi:uncharacterized protein with FMN-binding domain